MLQISHHLHNLSHSLPLSLFFAVFPWGTLSIRLKVSLIPSHKPLLVSRHSESEYQDRNGGIKLDTCGPEQVSPILSQAILARGLFLLSTATCSTQTSTHLVLLWLKCTLPYLRKFIPQRETVAAKFTKPGVISVLSPPHHAFQGLLGVWPCCSCFFICKNLENNSCPVCLLSWLVVELRTK